MDSRLRKRTTQIHTQGWRATESSPTTNDALEKRDTWRHPLIHILITFLCWTIPWPAVHYSLIVILSIDVFGILDSASAYESKFLFQSHFPLSATKQRSTRKVVGEPYRQVQGRSVSLERVQIWFLLSKKKKTWMIPPRLARYSLFFLFTFLLVVNQLFVEWPPFHMILRFCHILIVLSWFFISWQGLHRQRLR